MNCKPPCMAIVVECEWEPAIGMVVEVLELGQTSGGIFQWIVKPSRPMGCWDKAGDVIVREKIWCPDAWLKQITGLPITDDVMDEEKVLA